MHLCQAFHQDMVMQIPVKPPKKTRRIEKRTILLMDYQGRYLIHQREDKGLLAGLWELPAIEEKCTRSKLRKVLKEWKIEDYQAEPLGKAKHIFTHLEWHMEGYYIRLTEVPSSFTKENSYVWASKEELASIYALPSAFSAFTKGLE
jgi:A/G-specific adenine glycosylase